MIAIKSRKSGEMRPILNNYFQKLLGKDQFNNIRKGGFLAPVERMLNIIGHQGYRSYNKLKMLRQLFLGQVGQNDYQVVSLALSCINFIYNVSCPNL